MAAGVEAPTANSLRDINANIKTTQVAGGPASSAPTTPTTVDTTSKTPLSIVVPTNSASTNNNNENKKNPQGGVDGNEVAKTLALKMVQLNDVVSANNNGDGDDGDNINDNNNNRGRFLSYASGASTPNTSSDNLSGSWSG
ncbi:MAG: hypothetical protein ACI90V_007581, partial [Bacillariaceae sp.]